ncbi:MAG: hypothetical protein K2G22_07300 [Eubacterium sp.]|nr:hypothetical protein [Eubacterium sp.]
MLYKIAFLYFGNSYDAEDALQEVFIKLLYNSPSFKDLKNSINFVEPDDYMQTRIFAEISSKKKSKNKSRKGFKTAISAVLCCAILIVGLGFGIPKSNSKVTGDVDLYSSDGNIFILNVYAAENKESISITDHTVTVPDWKLSKEFDENGELDSINGYSENGFFSISGENIKYVKYTCETAYLDASDEDYKKYLIENDEYYDFIVPY